MTRTAKLIITGFVNFGLAKWLGATMGGALIMGMGGILWEAGNKGIPEGWKRWIGPF